MSRAFIVVGMTGSGKTYFTKQVLETLPKNNLLVFDVNDEYGDLYPYDFDPDMQMFLQKAGKIKNGVIVIEDATSFFSTQGRDQELVNLLIAKRHAVVKKNNNEPGNTYFLLFHAFADTPKYIYRKCTHVVIFKTPDSEKHLQVLGDDRLIESWREVQNQCKDHQFFSTYPPPKGVAPPSTIFSIY